MPQEAEIKTPKRAEIKTTKRAEIKTPKRVEMHEVRKTIQENIDNISSTEDSLGNKSITNVNCAPAPITCGYDLEPELMTMRLK